MSQAFIFVYCKEQRNTLFYNNSIVIIHNMLQAEKQNMVNHFVT